MKKNTLIYILLFLFSVNFINMEGRILLLLFVLILLTTGIRERLPVTKTSALLGVFSIAFYSISSFYNSSMLTYYILPFLLCPFMGYTIGYEIVNRNKNNFNNTYKALIYIIVFGRFLHGLLNYIASNGYANVLRNGQDFWTKSVLAATGQGALMTLSISLLFYALFIVNKKAFAEKAVLLFSVILSILNSVFSASRTAIVVMIVVFLVCLFYTVLFSKISKSKKRTIVVGFLALTLILFFAYQKDAFEMKTQWESSPLYQRITTVESYEIGDQNRIEMFISSIEIGINHPFGDGTTNTAHNLWLDTFKQTGWITFALLLAFTIVVIKNMIKLLKSPTVPAELKYLTLSVVLGFLLNFFVEPIMKGMPYYFVAFCVIAGGLEKCLWLNKLEEGKNEQ